MGPRRKKRSKRREGLRIVLVKRFFVCRGDGKILIIRRAPTDRRDPCHWEVPGGKVENGQHLYHSGRREVREETGLLLKQHLRHIALRTDRDTDGTLYLAIMSIAYVKSGTLRLSTEHDAAKWVTYGQLMHHKLTKDTRCAARDLRLYLCKL